METPSDLEIGTAIKPKNNWKGLYNTSIRNPGFCMLIGFLGSFFFNQNTLPETNIAPENRSLEREIRIGNHHV